MQLGSSVAVAVAQASATAPIQPLAWDLLYATGAAIKSKKKKKNFELTHLNFYVSLKTGGPYFLDRMQSSGYKLEQVTKM